MSDGTNISTYVSLSLLWANFILGIILSIYVTFTKNQCSQLALLSFLKWSNKFVLPNAHSNHCRSRVSRDLDCLDGPLAMITNYKRANFKGRIPMKLFISRHVFTNSLSCSFRTNSTNLQNLYPKFVYTQYIIHFVFFLLLTQRRTRVFVLLKNQLHF